MRAVRPAAAYAALPAAADGVKSIELVGSDSVTYTDAAGDVATAAVQLTDEDKTMLRTIRRTVLVS